MNARFQLVVAGRTRRLLGVIIPLAVVATSCSESFSASILHFCPDAVVVTADELGIEELRVTTVESGDSTVVWDYCCKPGGNGLVTFSSGSWRLAVEFDELRENDVVEVPAAACSSMESAG